METLLLILGILAVCYYLIYKKRSSRSSTDDFWNTKNRSLKADSDQMSETSKKFDNPKDVVERLSNASPGENTDKDEERFINLIDRCADNRQKKKLEDIIEKALENLPDHLKEHFFNDDWIPNLIVELYEDEEDVKGLLNLINRDTRLSREIIRHLGNERLASTIADSMHGDFEKNADETFSSLKKRIGKESDILDMAIERFVRESQEYIAEVKQDVEREVKLKEVKAKGESRLKSIIKDEEPESESYTTKHYSVFHSKGKKSNWFIRFHEKKAVPVLEFRSGEKEKIHALEEIDQMRAKIIHSINASS